MSPALVLLLTVSQTPTPRTGVVALDACEPPGWTTELQSLRDALSAQAGLKTMTAAETLAIWGGPSRGTQAEAEAELKKAQELFQHEGSVADAEAHATHALEIVRSLPPSNDRWDFERETQVLMSLIELKTGRDAAAEERIRKLMRVDSSIRTKPGVTPEPFMQRLEVVRHEAEAVPKFQLTVNTVPSGLPVFVDGVGVGASPVHPKLPAGDYVITARWGGSHRGLPVPVHVDAPASILLSAGFEGSVYADAGPCVVTEGDAGSRVSQLSDLGRALGAATMVGLREADAPEGAGKRLVALVVDAAKGRALREAAIMKSASASKATMVGLARFIATGTADDPGVRVVLDKPEEPPKLVEALPPPKPLEPMPAKKKYPESQPLRIASYITAGLATAAVAVGIYTFISADNADGQIQQLVDPTRNAYYAGTEAQYGQLAAEENLDRTLSVSLWLGAAACAVAAVTLYVTSGGWGGQPLVAGIGPGPSAGLTLHF